MGNLLWPNRKLDIECLLTCDVKELSVGRFHIND